jgi:hypothetical protein
MPFYVNIKNDVTESLMFIVIISSRQVDTYEYVVTLAKNIYKGY